MLSSELDYNNTVKGTCQHLFFKKIKSFFKKVRKPLYSNKNPLQKSFGSGFLKGIYFRTTVLERKNLSLKYMVNTYSPVGSSP